MAERKFAEVHLNQITFRKELIRTQPLEYHCWKVNVGQ